MTNASACGGHIRGTAAAAVDRHLEATDPRIMIIEESRPIRVLENGTSLCWWKTETMEAVGVPLHYQFSNNFNFERQFSIIVHLISSPREV